MILEFERFQMSSFRRITGILQILASLGLLLGFFYPWMALLSSLGLALQMLVGIGVRVRIKDTFFQIVPAAFFLILNLFIFYMHLFKI